MAHTALVDDVRSLAGELSESSSVDDRAVAERLQQMVDRYELGDLAANMGPAHHHPDQRTAVTAAELALPRAGTLREQIVSAVWDRGVIVGLGPSAGDDAVITVGDQIGVTQEEAAALLRRRHYSVAPRFAELQRLGWIKDSGRTRATSSGAQAIVWVLTDIALERLAP